MTVNSRAISARFAGKCRQCGKAVAKGEMVYFAKGYGVRCSGCGPHPSDAQPLPSKAAAKSGLSEELVSSLKNRLRSGEKVKALAAEVGIPWQRLWSILKTAQPAAPATSTPAPEAVSMGDRCAIPCEDGVWRYEFGSVGEATVDALADFAQNEENRKALTENMDDSLSGHRKWANHFTRAKFLKELSKPSKTLLNAVDDMRAEMLEDFAVPTTPRRKVRRNQEFGDDLDPERYLAKSITPWDRSVREQRPSRNITIGINLSVNAGADADDLMYRGAAALALADMMTTQGFNVGIVAFESCEDVTSKVNKAVVRYTLKDSTMPLDISAVAFAMCEIAWVRIVGVIGEMRHFPGTISAGYGRAVRLPAAEKKSCDFVIEKNVMGKEDAQQWLKTCVNAAQETEVAHV